MESRSVGSTLSFCISNWTEHYLSDSTDIIQVSDPKPVILISDYNMDMPEDSVYGVILDTGQHNKTVNKGANVIFSSTKELKENVNLLLERYVLSFLKDLFQNVSSRSNIDASS
ncbi:hypothetical protein DPMN_175170 [Dreissena polymorpha]|uniref:Uncharacterized protein n=1 Tax=Dreissena polymorpha TaxID=45954 RepID=A0A9D4E7C9_DREPO|nr:hypothetical protein DPMN_175170 [Dreissena polymorpha]